MRPAILSWLLWSAALLATALLVASVLLVSVSAVLAPSASSASVVASAIVAISVGAAALIYFGLEVGDGRHKGLHLGHHCLVLVVG